MMNNATNASGGGNDRVSSRPRRARKWAALSLAVALATPVAVTTLSSLWAAENPLAAETRAAQATPAGEKPIMLLQQPAQAPAEALKQGVKQYNAKQYEEAVSTLQSIDARALSEQDRKTLNDVLQRADSASAQRKSARAEFELGQESLKNKRPGEAIVHYNNVINNTYADEPTRQKAREQVSLAEAQRKGMSGDMRQTYQAAVADYKAGNLPAAKQKFEQLQAQGYQAAMFQRSPEDYLRDIAKRTPAEKAPSELAMPQDQNLTPAPAPKPGETAATPPAPAPVAPPVAAAPAESLEPAAPTKSARQLYVDGRNQYHDGDWINARKNLTAARQAGYKPRLFEDSPQTLLARMDRKEQNDARRSEQLAARRAEQEPRDQAPEPAPEPAPVVVAPAPAPAPAPDVVAQAAPPPAPVPPPPAAQTAPAPKPVPPPAPAPTEPVPPPAPAPRATAEQELADTARIQGTVGATNAARSKQLVEEGLKREKSNDIQGALDAYTQAAQLDPDNQQAVSGRNNMLTLLGRAPAASPALARAEEQINYRRQEVRYNFNTAIGQAQQATRGGDFIAADQALNQARNARNVDPNIFTEQELREFDTTINSTQLALTQARQEADARQRIETAQQTQEQIDATRKAQDEERRRTVADLRTQARQLINETRYTEALGVIDQILVIDPTNDYATGIRPLVEDKALFQQQRRFREDFDRQLTKQLNQAEEKKIPYDDILRYPANWPDISEMRDQTVALERGEAGADQAVQAQLDKKLPDLRFDAIGLTDVVEFLRDVTGSNIFVNWRALEAAGIDRNAPVTARLRDVKFSKALDTILDDVGGGTVPLGYTIDEGVITVSTEEDLSRNVLTRVYDIRDLIVEVPDFSEAPTFNLQNQTNQTSGQGGGGGGGGQSLFGGGSGGTGEETGQRTRQELVEEITLLITETVAPDSWRDAGGTVGAIRELQGQLIVTQTPENQRLLQGLLEQLRETRAIQVTVETRFLTVQRNYLEDIGFDIDATLNADGGDERWSTVPITQNSIQFTANPSTGIPGSLATTISTGGGGVGGLGLSSLGLTGTYLDNFTVTFLLRATQAAQSSTLVTAPRLTLFNGQRAYVLVSRQTAYVSDLEPVVAQQAVAFNPTIGLVQSGVLLDVQATVSSDRKYVTLTLRPQLATLIDLLPFTFQSTEGTAGTTQPVQDPDNPGTVIGTNPAAGTIQQPILQITEVRTTVSVPDGGTLLLGGQTLAGEVEREAGVPVLSKIPFLKRLFTNRSIAKDEQILLILVKPTIVIQREQEQRQFPLLSTRIAQ